jgi:hypothetical protein
MKCLFALFAFASLVFSPVYADEIYKYDIVLFGKSIGQGVAKKVIQPDGTIQYSLTTQAKAKVMFKDRTSQIDVKLNCSKDDNLLKSGNLKRERDGEWQHVSFRHANGKHIIDNDGKVIEESKPIKYTTTHFFFVEPKNVKEVYVERLQIFVPVVKESENTYSCKVDGGTNFYTYKDGKLVEFKTKQTITVSMNLIE